MLFPVEEKRSISIKIIHNVASGALRILFIAPVPFILTPLILHKVGPTGYGTWAVLVAISNLTSLADLGLLGTLSKYVAEYHAKRDFASLDRLLGTGLAVFGILAVLVVSLLWFVSPYIVASLFHGSAIAPVELLGLFHCLLVLVALNILMFPFSSVTSGLQRLDLTNLVSSGNVLCAGASGGGLLLLGAGLRGLLYGSIFSAALTVTLYALIVRRLLPQVALNPLNADLQEAKNIFNFSLQIYLTQGAAAIHNQIEKLYLGLFVGVVAAGWYDIASDVALKVRSAPQLLLGPILPAASELEARGQQDKLIELYYRTHKYLACVAVPLICFVVTISPRFVELWIGPNFKIVVLPLRILLLVNFFNLTTGPGYLIFAGQRILRPGVYSALVGLGLNIPMSFVLIYLRGFNGALVGTSFSLITASAFFIYLFHRQTRNSFARLFWEAYVKPVVYSIGLLILIFLIRPLGNHFWLGMFFQGLIFGVLYSALLLLSGFFDRYDWDRIESAAPIARFARRIVPVA